MTSEELFKRATEVIPGGVNSPVRAFNAVGGSPIYVASGAGSRITTVEGRELIDFCGSWGPLILGHADNRITTAISEMSERGTSFGINTPHEVEFAELLCNLIPCMDQVRLMSSGTEAVMTALRLARGYTGRSKILKFDGGYHGHSDSLLVSAGSGLMTAGVASSAGVSPAIAADTLVAPYNDCDAITRIVEEHAADLAAVVIEPIAGNMGLVPASPAFLALLRSLTERSGALLIFDEVISGFRLSATTYGADCGITPDITCLGKIIGGGMPIGALGGLRDIMQSLAPVGDVYQAGTLSGNPVAIAAGMATIKALLDTDPYKALEAGGARIAGALNDAGRGIPMHCSAKGGMFTPFFCAGPVTNMAEAKTSNTDMHAKFFNGMLDRGFYLPPSQFEVAFVSTAHSDHDIDSFIENAKAILAEL